MINGVNNNLGIGIGGVGGGKTSGPTSGASFADTLKNSIQEVSKLQQDASKAVEDLATGKTEDVTGVMTAMEKSDLAFKTLLAIRAKSKNLSPADLPDLASTFNGELKTDISIQEVRALLPIASQIQPESVKQIVLLGNYTSSQTINGADALVPNWQLIRPLVHQYFP